MAKPGNSDQFACWYNLHRSSASYLHSVSRNRLFDDCEATLVDSEERSKSYVAGR